MFIIHTFWSGPSNLVSDLCIERLRKMHPGWVVKVWDQDEFERDGGEVCPGFDSLSIQHKSDWVRICLLCRYGGVWLDSTCICVDSVTEWMNIQGSDVVGFEAPFEGGGTLENWALACPPSHPLMLAWKAEFREAIRIGF